MEERIGRRAIEPRRMLPNAEPLILADRVAQVAAFCSHCFRATPYFLQERIELTADLGAHGE